MLTSFLIRLVLVPDSPRIAALAALGCKNSSDPHFAFLRAVAIALVRSLLLVYDFLWVIRV